MAMVSLCLHIIVAFGLTLSWMTLARAQESARSWPKDTNIYSRPAVPGDTAAPPRAPPRAPTTSTNLVRVYDVIVNNTLTNLKDFDVLGGTETSIAVNPNNRNEIVMTAFSGIWSAYPSWAPLWLSRDGGQTWTKEYTVGQPFGVNVDSCPCDQTFDYGTLYTAGGPLYTNLFGSILAGSNGNNIYTGHIFDPALQGNWSQYLDSSTNMAERTNQNAHSIGQADQPWMLRKRGSVFNPNNEYVHVAYDDFGGSPVLMRVATSDGNPLPHFPYANDVSVGTSSGAINPGHRLATDPRNGWVYSLWQTCFNNCANLTDNPKGINYMLSRSPDDGVTWQLNGSFTGIQVASGFSTQPQPKFGTVNALLGGVLHAAVDPSTSDLYYVWGNRNTFGTNDLWITRVYNCGIDTVCTDLPKIVNNDILVAGRDAALPSVAVTSHGTIGVFFYTYDGIVFGFPQFTAWLAVSTDRWSTNTTHDLRTFLSPATDNGNGRQRVLGDFVQMKALDNCFYGSFVANRAAFYGSTAIDDPVFFKACYGQSASTHDLSGDGFSDVLWRNSDGGVALWTMFGGNTILSSAGIGNVPTNWQIVGQRDFDGDGFSDVLWRDNGGGVAMWMMQGATITQAVGVGNVPTNWVIVSTGDFNGDGFADILWRDTISGGVAMWLMVGPTIIGSAGVGNVPTNWVIAGTGDFNGDGMSDILWRDNNSGGVAMWLLSGTSIIGNFGVGNVPTNWVIAGTGDFNGDGMSDILWRDNNSGGVTMWLMNGAVITSSLGVGNVSTNWQIAQTGDYNGDGMSDVLWRDNNSGGVAMWLMNGGTITSSLGVGNVPTSWQIQGVNAD
jgi:hypothetical protein